MMYCTLQCGVQLRESDRSTIHNYQESGKQICLRTSSSVLINFLKTLYAMIIMHDSLILDQYWSSATVERIRTEKKRPSNASSAHYKFMVLRGTRILVRFRIKRINVILPETREHTHNWIFEAACPQIIIHNIYVLYYGVYLYTNIDTNKGVNTLVIWISTRLKISVHTTSGILRFFANDFGFLCFHLIYFEHESRRRRARWRHRTN